MFGARLYGSMDEFQFAMLSGNRFMHRVASEGNHRNIPNDIEETEELNRVLEQSKRETDEYNRIKNVIYDHDALKSILGDLEGVNSDDPIFDPYFK